MRRASALLAAALLTPFAGAVAGTVSIVPGANTPAGASDGANPPSTILSGLPVFSTDLPEAAPHEGQPPSAVGASPNGHRTAASDDLSNGTVRMLLSPPPPDLGNDD